MAIYQVVWEIFHSKPSVNLTVTQEGVRVLNQSTKSMLSHFSGSVKNLTCRGARGKVWGSSLPIHTLDGYPYQISCQSLISYQETEMSSSLHFIPWLLRVFQPLTKVVDQRIEPPAWTGRQVVSFASSGSVSLSKVSAPTQLSCS